MSQTPENNDNATAESVTRCRKLTKALSDDWLTFENYCYNVTITIVGSPFDEVLACVDTLPHNHIVPYENYLRTTLEPVDFMPCPRPFLAGMVTEEMTERRKRELRPHYVQLYQLIKERCP